MNAGVLGIRTSTYEFGESSSTCTVTLFFTPTSTCRQLAQAIGSKDGVCPAPQDLLLASCWEPAHRNGPWASWSPSILQPHLSGQRSFGHLSSLSHSFRETSPLLKRWKGVCRHLEPQLSPNPKALDSDCEAFSPPSAHSMTPQPHQALPLVPSDPDFQSPPPCRSIPDPPGPSPVPTPVSNTLHTGQTYFDQCLSPHQDVNSKRIEIFFSFVY